MAFLAYKPEQQINENKEDIMTKFLKIYDNWVYMPSQCYLCMCG